MARRRPPKVQLYVAFPCSLVCMALRRRSIYLEFEAYNPDVKALPHRHLRVLSVMASSPSGVDQHVPTLVFGGYQDQVCQIISPLPLVNFGISMGNPIAKEYPPNFISKDP
ncbi:uncharacterized protein LOC126615981 [Malus sylvestris]|uniref:uncharacterized protein LOC126615981 n=1 Tax=Malus sylvestris TaxID=3752 RepID=UPI0021ACA021|nr:uncharacterized protein LOC126615981 [Malus sylvestris]